MSIAGALGFSPDQRSRDTHACLTRLAYNASNQPQLLQDADIALGIINEASLWRGEGILATFDGALYERAELTARLNLPPEASNAQIAGHALLQWGDTFPNQLDGEYAFAVWDSRRHTLLLGRDAMSRGVLFYGPVADGFCFASEPQALRAWPGIDGRIEDEAIARILSVQPKPGATLYRGVFVVKGGDTLLLQRGRAPKTVRYWNPLGQPELHLRDWRQYAEALHDAMITAVSRRLPATGLVGSQMSSGFDSSSVTALAAQALAKQNRPLVAYTSVPVHRTNAKEILNDRFDDEWPLASQVAAMYPNIEHVAIRTDGADWWDSLDVMAKFAGGPAGFIRNARWYYGILHNAQTRGLVTMLEGQAGNLTGSYNGGFGLYDLRKKGEWLTLARAIRNRRRHGAMWKTLANGTWMPSAKSRARLQRIRRKPMPKLFELTLMRRDFYERSGLEQREHSVMGSVIEGDRSSGRAWRYSMLKDADLGMMHAMQMRAFGLRREDPTADRRLIELCLSIPDEMFAPNGIKRELYREAFRNDLPAELLAEPLRGLQSSDFLPMFEEWLPQWRQEMDRLETSPLVARCLDLPRMRQMLNDWPRITAGPRAAADQLYNYTFGGAIALGRFLRQHEEADQAK